MAKKGNRQIYKVINKETGSFYVSAFNRLNKIPAEIKKFDKKLKKHVLFKIQKFK
jgi:ribosomal protein L33